MHTHPMNVPPVSVAAARAALAEQFADPVLRRRATMLWGARGVGKSSIVRQVAQQHGVPLIDLRLTTIEPVDLRGAIYAGAELPTGTGGFGSVGVDPCVGGVLTGIFGRNGFDVAARWTFVTDESPFLPTFAGTTTDDYANIDLGYAFRLYPEAYGEERVPAWYATLELNSIVTTGTEYEVLLSPGLLLEAPTYAVELGVQIPVSSDVDDAPDLRVAAVVGLRLIF